MDLKGKVALVTGAGAGIGRGCAVELARAGATVILNDSNEGALQGAWKEIVSLGNQADIQHGDMFVRARAEKMVKTVCGIYDRIDILVTGPASTVNEYVDKLEPEDFLKTLNDDLVSHCYLARLVAEDMIARNEGGKIIFISSVYGTLNRKKHLTYDTAKAGLNHATRVFARELGQHGILVNAIAPGFTLTPGERKYANDDQIREIESGLLLGRGAKPEEIGEAAVFLAKHDYITGIVLTVDGGMSLVDYTYDKSERR